MKKKRILLILLCIIILCTLLTNLLPSYSSVLDANWGFSLPVRALCLEVYEKDSGPSFHGDGVRYHVFSYQFEEAIGQMLAWSSAEGKTVFQETYRDAANGWLDDVEVPTENRPDFGQCLFWYDRQEDNSQILVCWNPQEKTVSVIESFI